MIGHHQGLLKRMGRAAGALVCSLFVTLGASVAHGQCRYEVTVIEGPRSDALGQALLYGVGLNEQGHVVGYFHYTGGWNRPFLWTDETGLVELPLPPDSYEAWAGDINEAGQIVGSMTHNDLGFRGFLYEDGEYTVVGPVIPDAGWSSSSAINNDGRVVGYRSITEEVNPYNAYIWSAEDGFTDLGVMEGPYSAARDISETGLVVGWTGYPTPADEAFLWDDGELTILGPIPGGISSSARSVNNRGEIVGNSATEVGRSSELRGLGFMWHEGDWTLLQPIAGYDESGAAAINDLSQIVGSSGPIGPGGSHPTLWQNEQPWDLNDLANVEHGFTMEACDDINNRGQIIAEGYDAQYISVTFLLTPIGRPTGDITGDCNVGVADLLFLLAEWGKTDSPADINDDGVVGVWDLLALLGDWGS